MCIRDSFTYVYKNSTGTDSYFINKRAAALLLARTYLDMGEYDNARMYAEAVGLSLIHISSFSL